MSSLSRRSNVLLSKDSITLRPRSLPPGDTDTTCTHTAGSSPCVPSACSLSLLFSISRRFTLRGGEDKCEAGRGPLKQGDQTYVALRTTRKMHDKEKHLASSFARSSRSCSAVTLICSFWSLLSSVFTICTRRGTDTSICPFDFLSGSP